MRDPKLDPRKGDKIFRSMTNRNGVTGIFTRTVMGRIPMPGGGMWIVWTRKRPDCLCKCTITAWRRWAKDATVVS